MHSGFIIKESKYNIGILLKYPLNELNKEGKEEKSINKNEIIKKNELVNKTNEIKIIVKIDKDDNN